MCFSALLKVVLYLISVFIFFLGVTILGIGATVIVDSSPLLGVLKNMENYSQLLQLVNISYMLIAVGPVLLVTSFLGCYAEFKESRIILLMYFLILLIVFLVKFAGATVLFVHRDSILSSRGDEVLKNFRLGYGDDESLTSLWNNTMVELNCFDGSPFDVAHGGNVYPPMCCNSRFTGVSDIDGCYDKVLQEIEKGAVLTAAMALLTGAVEIVAMVVSMTFYCKGRNVFRR
ncbi:tetraspanin-1-like [Mugil cephalus]|uniref:tetraspanin-1-like n=1 Tax=Mugil cephalus TaxID=48193 RepID=UPI001FB58ED6|nr:tetraspanin-1-like [Mugil cephalus]